ncbi:MAG TPA: hypothetical protein VJL82_08860 [Rhizomicrobium sp.]|nr:hypothetical protein [Rhizomicrobium sp.]
MSDDLTESVYAMIVLAYATLAVSSYILNSIDNQTRIVRDRIDGLIEGDCKYIRKANPSKLTVAQRGVIDFYDKIKTKPYEEWGPVRWPILPYLLFASVICTAILLFPVLLLHLGVGESHPEFLITIKICTVLVQLLSSVTVPAVALNVREMNKKLRPLEKLLHDLELMAAPGQILNRDGAPSTPSPKPKKSKEAKPKPEQQNSNPG